MHTPLYKFEEAIGSWLQTGNKTEMPDNKRNGWTNQYKYLHSSLYSAEAMPAEIPGAV